jgi:hypothetical protein
MTAELFNQRTNHAGEEFDPFKDHTVVEFQPLTSVFLNDAGGITILQDQTGWMGDDEVIVVFSTKEAVQAVIKSLQQKLGEM